MQQHLFRNAGIDEVAIDMLREFAPKDGAPLFVAYSGGKDSTVILDVVKRSGLPFEAHYHYVPLDPPELRAFIREQARDPGNCLTIDRPARSLVSMAHEKQFLPRRAARWCCELFKHPTGTTSATTVLGVRWAESSKRSRRASVERRRSSSGLMLNPIIGWSTADVWAYIRERGLPYCFLYDEHPIYTRRLGCVLCPLARNGSANYQAKAQWEISRWPGIARLWRRVSDIAWSYHQPDFATPDDLWAWWLRSEPVSNAPDDGECGLFGPPVEVADEVEGQP